MCQKTTLLYLSEDYPYSKVHHELCSHIVHECNVDVILYSVIRSGIKNRDLRSSYKCINYQPLYYELDVNEWRYKLDFSFKVKTKYDWLIQHCDIAKIKLVHAATFFSEGAIALKLYKEKSIPYIVTVRGTDINFYFKYMFHLWNLGIDILRYAQKVIFLTENALNIFFSGRMEKFSMYKSDKCIVIPNGIDDYWIENRTPKKDTLSPFHLLYIGVFDKNKNVLLLQDAVLQLKKKYPALDLTLVGGGGECHDAVIKYCKQYPNTFFYKGKIYNKERLSQLIRNNDIFAMISHSETFGLVYLEALSQGLPILYTKGQGIDGIFQERIGEAVSSIDKRSVIDGLTRLIEDYSHYSTSINFYQFSWKAIAHVYFEIYLKIL